MNSAGLADDGRVRLITDCGRVWSALVQSGPSTNRFFIQVNFYMVKNDEKMSFIDFKNFISTMRNSSDFSQ